MILEDVTEIVLQCVDIGSSKKIKDWHNKKYKTKFFVWKDGENGEEQNNWKYNPLLNS